MEVTCTRGAVFLRVTDFAATVSLLFFLCVPARWLCILMVGSQPVQMILRGVSTCEVSPPSAVLPRDVMLALVVAG